MKELTKEERKIIAECEGYIGKYIQLHLMKVGKITGIKSCHNGIIVFSIISLFFNETAAVEFAYNKNADLNLPISNAIEVLQNRQISQEKYKAFFDKLKEYFINETGE